MGQSHQVSTRVTSMLLDYAEGTGRGLPDHFDLVHLRARNGWVDWSTWTRLIRAVAATDEPQGLKRMGIELMEYSAKTPFRHMGLLTGGNHALYEATYAWVLGANIPVIHSTVTSLSESHIEVELRLESDLEDGRAFFHATAGTMERLPGFLGIEPARVLAEIGTHLGRYRIELGVPSNLSARAKRAWRSLTDTEGLHHAMHDLWESMQSTVRSLQETNQRLRISEERWRAVTGAMPGVVAVVDGEGQILSLLGRDVGVPNAIGSPILQLAPPEQRPGLAKLIERLGAGEMVEDEATVLSPEGAASVWHFRASPMPGEDSRAVVVAIDISEWRQTQVALRESEQRLVHAQKMEVVARLAGGLAHDVNNLLAAVRGHAELLALVGGSNADVDRATSGILAAVDRASAMTRRVLAYGAEAVFDPRVVELGTVVLRARDLMDRVLGHHVSIRLALSEEPVAARIDPGQIEQVLLNLAINARDALPTGGWIEIRTEVAGDRALLSVRDNGLGMPPEVLARASEPFFTTKDAREGSGLGLSTVSSIAHGFEGEVFLDSEVGAGTTVTLSFPLARLSEVELAESRLHEGDMLQPPTSGDGEALG